MDARICRMNILLISTYELGRQPFGVASPAAWLRARGHEVACLDLTRQALDEEAILAADLICFYVPMHTATRLAAGLIPTIRDRNARAHLCFYGLYAPVNEEYLRGLGVDTILGGEFEEGLASLASRLQHSAPNGNGLDEAAGARDLSCAAEISCAGPRGHAGAWKICARGHARRRASRRGLDRSDARLQASLPPLPRSCRCITARFEWWNARSSSRISGSRWRRARGTSRLAIRIFSTVRRTRFPLWRPCIASFRELTYDVTIKIEHLRKHDALLPVLRDTGCLFVTSAVESVDDAVLEKFDKGHTRADFLAVVARFRELGMTLLPTFVPFTPWTTFEGYTELLDVLAEEGLCENVAPIQLAIRLLIPAGSRLLELPEVSAMVGPFDSAALVFPWKHEDARVDALAREISQLVQRGDSLKLSRTEIFSHIRRAAHAAAGNSRAESHRPFRHE